MSPQWQVIQPETEIDKLLYEFTTIIRTGWIEVGEEKTTMPLCYGRIADEIENFEVKDTDIFVISYPKTGTTWTQEMVWMTYNYDFERGAKIGLKERFPFLEYPGVHDFNTEEFKAKYPNHPRLKYVVDVPNFLKESTENPRFIKCHLPWSLLPRDIRENRKSPKIIYVMRNPRDSCVSYFHHCRLMEGYTGNFDNFCKLYLAGKIDFGSFWNNVKGFWAQRNKSNILIIRFEDMKKDLKSVVKRVAEFLGKERTDEEIEKLVDHLSFENMKNNTSVNNKVGEELMRDVFQNGTENERFMRLGRIGTYKAEMTQDMIKKFDEWTAENTKGTDIIFSYS